MAVARTESPGPSRFVLPIAGLIGLGLCGAGILVLLDPQGGPNLLASIYDAMGNGSGATDLRNGSGDQVVAKLLLAVIALAVGVGGIWLLFLGVGALVSLLQPKWRDRILPWVFAGPALALLGVFLVYPAVGTIIRSLTNDAGNLTLDNFAVMTEPEFVAVLRNNVIWLIVGTGFSVVLGLIFAGLFDRIRRESLAKTIVFLPLAISLVGASVIWGFVYAFQPAGQVFGAQHRLVVAVQHGGFAHLDQLFHALVAEHLAHRPDHLHRHFGVRVRETAMAGFRQIPDLGRPAAPGAMAFGVDQPVRMQPRHLLAHRFSRHVHGLRNDGDGLRAARLQGHEHAVRRLMRRPGNGLGQAVRHGDNGTPGFFLWCHEPGRRSAGGGGCR